MLIPYDGPIGASLVLTAAALCLHSLYTTVVVYRKVSLGRALNWFNLVLASFWTLIDASTLAKGTAEHTTSSSFYLANRSAFLGSGGGLMFLLRNVCLYLYEDHVVDAQIKPRELIGILRWRMKADLTRDLGLILLVSGHFVFPFWESPGSSSPGPAIIAAYVGYLLVRAAALGFTVVFIRVSCAAGLVTLTSFSSPSSPARIHGMVASVGCGAAQLLLEVVCAIFGPRWLATALVVCLQAGIAMMLFVGHLELRHRAAIARPLNGDLPFASSAKDEISRGGPKAA